MAKSSFFNGTGVSSNYVTDLESITEETAALKAAAAVSAAESAASANSVATDANVASSNASAAQGSAAAAANSQSDTASSAALALSSQSSAASSESASAVSAAASLASQAAASASEVASAASQSASAVSEANASTSAATSTTKASESAASAASAASIVGAINQGVSTTDSPTFAGASLTGDLTVTGTVDGRDVAADGTKLDGIEAGATADQVGLIKGADIGGSIDLNTYTTNGYFHQNFTSGAGSGTNYPSPVAGMLSVQADGSMVYQKYQTYNGDGTWQRTKYQTTWFAWDKILDTGNAVAFTSADNTKLDGIETGATADQTFDQLLSKTSGTGEYSTTSHITSGRGGGGVAMTINDGYGNANLTFNHKSGVPEQLGNGGRIVVNTDATSAPSMSFQLGSATAAGVAYAATDEMQLFSSGLYVYNDIEAGGSIISNGSVTAADLNLQDTSPRILLTDTDGTNQWTSISEGGGNTFYISRNDATKGQHIFQQVAGSDYTEAMRINTSGNVQITGSITSDTGLLAGAGASVGAVGTYALLQVKDAFESTARAAGSTLAGSSLGFTAAGNLNGVTPNGTWRLMGQMNAATSGQANTSVWLRIV